jgi:hypothetical protein
MRQERLAWLTQQYATGRLLVAFGFDSLHLGQQARFKGMRFASTDQASVIWFGSSGAVYATAKPLLGIDAAIDLLRQAIAHQPRAQRR